MVSMQRKQAQTQLNTSHTTQQNSCNSMQLNPMHITQHKSLNISECTHVSRRPCCTVVNFHNGHLVTPVFWGKHRLAKAPMQIMEAAAMELQPIADLLC